MTLGKRNQVGDKKNSSPVFRAIAGIKEDSLFARVTNLFAQRAANL
jgi:hypothetical protein